MYIKKIVLFLLLAISCLCVKAQKTDSYVIVSGHVIDTDLKALEFCYITVMNPSDSSIIAYDMTDKEGKYSVAIPKVSSEVLINLSGFDVKRQIARIKTIDQKLDFKAEIEVHELEEVQIKAKRMWLNRDTLNYLVGAYVTEFDHSIGDVLKQMPGISIDDNGTINYQGVPINHFYIENIDLLQGRYGLATNGIKAADVATVQVMENHEHVLALQDQNNQTSAAINLKLKEDVKGVWTKNADLGLGGNSDRVLWHNSLNAMVFAKGDQHAFFYDNDNTGLGSNTAKSHYGSTSESDISKVGVRGHWSSPVGNGIRNNLHSININNMNKLTDTTQLHYNLHYEHDIRHGTSLSRTTYVMADGSNLVMNENIADHYTTNQADLQLVYENNSKKEYLHNKLTLSGSWKESGGEVLSNEKNIAQHAYHRTFGLKNNTHWTHRTQSGGGFSLSSTSSLATSPQALTVFGDMQARQEVDVLSLSTSNNFELLHDFTHHNFSITPSASLDANYVKMTSLLNRNEILQAANGNMQYTNLSANLALVFRYKKNTFDATLSIPLSYRLTNLNNSPLLNEKTDVLRQKLMLKSYFILLWKANEKFTFDFNADYQSNENPWDQLYTAYVMSSYSNMNRYQANLFDAKQAGCQMKISFKEVMSGWFAYLHGSCSRSWSDVLYGTTIDSEAHTVLEAQQTPNHSLRYSASLNFCKNIDWHDIVAEVTASWNRSESEVLRQSIVTDYSLNSYSLKGRLSFNVVRGYRLDYYCNWSMSDSHSTNYSSTIKTLSQRATIDLRIIESRLYLSLSGNHTHNSGFSGKKDYVFVDAGLKLKTKNKMEWSLDCMNLFNNRRFISRSSDAMTEWFSEYYLNPRSLILRCRFSL